MQLLWILIGLAAVNLMWHFGIKRYSAVGN
jgi:ABC-type uncharacterized transport system permease subunit